MQDFDRLWIWQEPRIARALAWYRAVATDRMPAKFRIAATVPCTVDLAQADEEGLWAEFERASAEFLARWGAIREGRAQLSDAVRGPSLLELCRVLAERMLQRCSFCRWECGIDRTQPGRRGACRLEATSRISCAFHHPGEELVFRGLEGSGTIFFTSCNMRCAFCQNGDISTDATNGQPVEARDLATIAFCLRRQGCHNINWVGGEPTVHLHRIVEAIALLGRGFTPDAADRARIRPLLADGWQGWPERAMPGCGVYAGGFNAPILWNSNMYLGERPLRLLRVLVDVWLPDFKFGPGRCAIRLARTPRYFETVTHALSRLAEWGEDTLVRHLVMPAHVECCTQPVLEWLAEHMPDVPVNIMDQYHPDMFADPRNPLFREEYRDIARRPTSAELTRAFAYARRLNLCFEDVSFEKRRLFA